MRRKIDAANGTSNTYRFGDGTRVILAAGHEEVTAEMVKALKRLDNAEYNNNLKNWGPEPTAQEKEDWKKRNSESPCPRKLNVSLDYESDQARNDAEKLCIAIWNLQIRTLRSIVYMRQSTSRHLNRKKTSSFFFRI